MVSIEHLFVVWTNGAHVGDKDIITLLLGEDGGTNTTFGGTKDSKFHNCERFAGSELSNLESDDGECGKEDGGNPETHGNLRFMPCTTGPVAEDVLGSGIELTV